MPPLAVRAAKAAVRAAAELPLSVGLAAERETFFGLFDSDDQAEGMARLQRQAHAGLDRTLSAGTQEGPMERDTPGGSDVGRDIERDLGDEPPPSYRDAAPDYLAPIDDSSPVSGHTPAPESAASAVDSPEHDWAHAQGLIYPAFRPVGTQGLDDRVARPRPPRRPGGGESRPAAARRRAGRPAGRLHDRCRRVRHRRQRRPPAVVGHRGIGDPGRGHEEPVALVRDLHRGPTRSPAIAGWSARTPATAGMPPGSCCPRSSPTSQTELGAYGRVLVGSPSGIS